MEPQFSSSNPFLRPVDAYANAMAMVSKGTLSEGFLSVYYRDYYHKLSMLETILFEKGLHNENMFSLGLVPVKNNHPASYILYHPANVSAQTTLDAYNPHSSFLPLYAKFFSLSLDEFHTVVEIVNTLLGKKYKEIEAQILQKTNIPVPGKEAQIKNLQPKWGYYWTSID